MKKLCKWVQPYICNEKKMSYLRPTSQQVPFYNQQITARLYINVINPFPMFDIVYVGTQQKFNHLMVTNTKWTLYIWRSRSVCTPFWFYQIWYRKASPKRSIVLACFSYQLISSGEPRLLIAGCIFMYSVLPTSFLCQQLTSQKKLVGQNRDI